MTTSRLMHLAVKNVKKKVCCPVADLVCQPQIPRPDSHANSVNPRELASEMTQTLDTVLSTTVHKNFLICEAYGCNRQAIKQIAVSAGKLGYIDLNLSVIYAQIILKFYILISTRIYSEDNMRLSMY